MLKEKRYFFSKKAELDVNKENKKRGAGCGYWKPKGKGKQIVVSNQTVGVRKTLVFHAKQSDHRACKTQWVMHEYRLVASGTTPNTFNQVSTHV